MSTVSFLFFKLSLLAFNPSQADEISLAAFGPELTAVGMQLHGIGLSVFLHPAYAGMDVLQPEMLTAEACLGFLLHCFPSLKSTKESDF